MQEYEFSEEEMAVLNPPQRPPEILWIVIEVGSNPHYEIIFGDKYLRFYEKMEDAKPPLGKLGQVLLCEVFALRIQHFGNLFYRVREGVWLSESIHFPDLSPAESWSDSFLKKYVGFRMLLAEPEWFEGVKRICVERRLNLPIMSDSLEGLCGVKYMWKRGGPLHGYPLFLVSQLSEDDYIFSDKKHFLFANIPWEWLYEYDRIRWQEYDKLEDLIPRHCYEIFCRVPLDYLGTAFSEKILHYRPTMHHTWFMWSEEEGYHGHVILLAQFGDKNGVPCGVKSISLRVEASNDDPAAIERTLISGSNDEIFDWLKRPENLDDISLRARQMLQEYESMNGAKA